MTPTAEAATAVLAAADATCVNGCTSFCALLDDLPLRVLRLLLRLLAMLL